jgi:hypothetical protein
MDSDKSSQQTRINETKARVEKEIDESAGRGFGWITQGRYIESYIPPKELAEVLTSLYSGKEFVDNTSKYSDSLRLADKETGRVDKIKVAKEVCTRWKSGLHSLDLYSQVLALAELIEAANGLEAPKRPPKVEPEFA